MPRYVVLTRFSLAAERFVLSTVLLLSLLQVATTAEDAVPPKSDAERILCLHTEYLPNPHAETGVMETRIGRELGRQAVLLAARDELGMRTRDETLGEHFPDAVTTAKRDVSVRVRAYRDGKAQINLWTAAASAPERGEVDPAAKKNKHISDAVLLVADKFEDMSRRELVDKLRANGFDGKVPPANEANVPSDEIEGQLLEMNFVSQFAAVRSAHLAIASKGKSRAWLGVLARGYANLALMTEHHWRSDTEAFAARALLYALRLTKSNPDNAVAHAHLAYVESIIGLHAAALKEVDYVDEHLKSAGDAAPVPNCLELVRPFCTFKRDALFATIEQRKSLRQLAQRLSFEQTRAIEDNNLVMTAARQTIANCPEEYSVYAITSNSSSLGVMRLGAFDAPTALERLLPVRIASLRDLPKPVQDAATGLNPDSTAGDTPADKQKNSTDDAASESSSFAAATFPVVKALRAATASGHDNCDPSYSMLGELIYEELFVQAANYLRVSLNATESSHEAEVKAMMAVLKDHRYSPYLACYAVDHARDPDRYTQVLEPLQIVDPRGNMRDMLARIWRMKGPEGKNDRGMNASWSGFSDCGLTFTDMLEASLLQSSVWWGYLKAWQRKEIGADFQAISPFSPQTLRIKLGLVDEPTYEQLTQWESEAGEDPAIFVRLAARYNTLAHFDDAIRCYERSIELSPSKDAFVRLANAYRASGQEDKWQPTLERFFEVPSFGLEQAGIHDMIAKDLMSHGKWQEAEPHAVASAQTYSAWGLATGSQVYEGLKQLGDSEKYARAVSENYPSSSGDEWYFWCIRNDAGDIEAARKAADSFYAMKSQDIGFRQMRVAFIVSKGEPAAALKEMNSLMNDLKTLEAQPEVDVFNNVFAAQLNRQTKNAAAEKLAIAAADAAAAKLPESGAALGRLCAFVCRTLEGKKLSSDGAADFEKNLASEAIPVRRRCTYNYFLGVSLELSGDPARAKECYQRARDLFQENRPMSALAGKRLRELAAGEQKDRKQGDAQQ